MAQYLGDCGEFRRVAQLASDQRCCWSCVEEQYPIEVDADELGFDFDGYWRTCCLHWNLFNKGKDL